MFDKTKERNNEFLRLTHFLESVNRSLITASEIESSGYFVEQELKENILLNVFVLEKCVNERWNKYDWAIDVPIYIPSISDNVTTLFYAYGVIQQKLFFGETSIHGLKKL